MRSALLLKLCIFVFVLIFIRYWAIQQIWIPAEEHIRQLGRENCTPDEAIFHAMGKLEYHYIFRDYGTYCKGTERQCCMKYHSKFTSTECHLPILIHAKNAILEHQARGEEFIVGTEDCLLLLTKMDEQGNRQKFYAVWYKGDDGRIQWNVEPYEQETE